MPVAQPRAGCRPAASSRLAPPRLLLPLLATLLTTTALTAFHSLQTIAPTHGLAGDAWESALERLGLEVDADGTMQALVEPEGYPLEVHFVTTMDGYILQLFRIPHGNSEREAERPEGQQALLSSLRRQLGSVASPASGKPAVLLQHALLDCSASWVNNGAFQSLGFLLADAGFDVWMGNVRGNSFSRNHTTLSTGSEAFWDFSWDDMAAHDLPAMVDFVLRHTGGQRLGYVGHSQGTTMALAALSSQPSLARKLSVAVLLAPVAFTTHITSSPIRTMANLDTEQVFELMGSREFLPSRKVNHDAWARFCHLTPSSCQDAIGLICGYNPNNVNTTRLPLYLSYTPAGTSVKDMAQWSQGVRREQPQFLRFDYGKQCRDWFGSAQPCNRRMYGQDSPPAYDLSRVTVPLMLVTGTPDKLSDPQDVALLEEALPAGVVVARHEEPSYEHLDFTWAHNAHRLIYPGIMRVLAERSGLALSPSSTRRSETE
eukprot:jgi/Tetstr1/446548/TSEL_034073.t1